MSIRLGPVHFFALIIFSGIGVNAQPVWNADAFASLTSEDQLTVISAALYAREDALSNFTYTVSEDRAILATATGERTPLNVVKREMTLKRLGSEHIFESTNYDEANGVSAEVEVAWKDDRLKATTKLPQLAAPKGVINSIEPDLLKQFGYNNLLGFRTSGSGETLAKWFDTQYKLNQMRMETAEEEGTSYLKIIQEEGITTRTYWVDPNRGFAPVRYEFFHGNENRNNHETHEAESLELIDDVWVPTRIRRVTGASVSPDAVGEYVYKMTNFDVGAVTASDMDLEFPIGTKVFDHISNIAFEVTADGVTPLPIYDPNTGQVVDGTGKVVFSPLDLKDIAKNGKADVGDRESEDHIEHHDSLSGSNSLLTSRNITIVVGLLLLAVGGVVILRR